MTSSSSSSSLSSSTKSSPSTTTNYQSSLHKSTASTSSQQHHLHHHNHHNHHYYPHHRAPMPSPQYTRQHVGSKPVKNTPVSPYLTRAAIAMAGYTPPTTHSRSQVSLSSVSPSSSPRSPASLSSASRVSLGTNPSGGSSISLLSTGSASGLKGGSGHIGIVVGGEGGASLDPSSPRIPLTNSRRTRLQAATRRK